MSSFESPDNSPSTQKSFYEDKHIKYIKKVATDTESFEFVITQHLRMSGVYWGLTALSVLGTSDLSYNRIFLLFDI